LIQYKNFCYVAKKIRNFKSTPQGVLLNNAHYSWLIKETKPSPNLAKTLILKKIHTNGNFSKDGTQRTYNQKPIKLTSNFL